ncbi:MAG: 50S ribosomal protein L22 [Caldisericia bacterium]|nr:50S ribosomal protein L22 [Caldisericia bacterium]
MEVKAQARFVRISPKKARKIANMVRGMNAKLALKSLKFVPNRAAVPIAKTIKSAIANAKNNYQMDEESLFITKIFVDQGPVMKRILPRAMGRADIIRRPLSHITVYVEEKKEE